MDALAHERYWYNPLCPGFPIDNDSWDVQDCFQKTVLAAVPPAVFALVGGFEFPGLWRRYRDGERQRVPAQGEAAHRVKSVRSPFPSSSSSSQR